MTNPSRRRLLHAGGTALATILAGCPARLDDDPPPRRTTTRPGGRTGVDEPGTGDPRDEVIGLVATNDRDEPVAATVTGREQDGRLLVERAVELGPGETVVHPRLLPVGTDAVQVRSQSRATAASYEWDSAEACSESNLHVWFAAASSGRAAIVFELEPRCE